MNSFPVRGSTGRLVTKSVLPADDYAAFVDEELAEALVRVLSDRALAERLGAGARDSAAPWLQTPQEYARRVRELVG